MTNTVKHFHALFSLPSHGGLLALLVFGVPALCGTLYAAYFLSIEKAAEGAIFSLFTLTLPSLILDPSLNYLLGSPDPILTKRRLSGVSLFQAVFWLLPPLFFLLFSPFLGNHLPISYGFSIGFGFALALRLSIFYSVSTIKIERVIAISIIHPVISMVSMFIAWGDPNSKLLLITILSGGLGCIGALGFLTSLNGFGLERIGMPTFRLFRAFISNWTEGVHELLESYLEDISSEKDLSIVFLAFKSSGKIKAVLAVPNFHPGPFKNVGSSSLPFLLEESISQKTGSFVAVMHGTSGHEHDLPSQAENEKFISAARQLLKFTGFSPYATMIRRSQTNRGKASCQRFGKGLLVTLTRAPESTEDLPPEVGATLTKFGYNRRFSHVAVVDSHNSIDNDWFPPQKEVKDVEEAAKKAISRSLKDDLSHFEVGVSKLHPETYSLDQGIGPSGISVIAVKIRESIICYITLDGNNLVSGLREKILSRVHALGVSDGEVVTTDTHMVNTLSLSDLGYHPIGEVIDQDLFIDQVCSAVRSALKDLEPAEAAWSSGPVKHMKVFGLESLKNQLDFVHDAVNYAKISAIASYGSCLLILFVLCSRLIPF